MNQKDEHSVKIIFIPANAQTKRSECTNKKTSKFNHLFSSDAYSAGYYSYLWSETMDADTWVALEEAGSPWDEKTAEGFRSLIMATANKTDRKAAYREFLGRDAEVKYILRKRGFLVPGE